jgi:cell fate regulator YaaT (PSP1 superfamily)
MNVVEIKFDNVKDTSFFINKKFKIRKNLNVIVDSDRGLQYGTVVNVFNNINKFSNLNLYDVVRVSSKKDHYKHLENLSGAKEAVVKCKELVKKYNLSMNILDASYNFDKTQLMFRFVADERVDFRQLAKELGAVFKTRIELRQVGIRDKAKEIGGVGPCGRLLCCSSFLKSFDSVTISMAKNQSVSLNPSKINGVCGRLLCCLKYENDIYTDMKSYLPKIGSFINYNNKKVKVVAVDILKKKCKLQLMNKKIIEVDSDDCKK